MDGGFGDDMGGFGYEGDMGGFGNGSDMDDRFFTDASNGSGNGFGGFDANGRMFNAS